jgi:hypothetical protein
MTRPRYLALIEFVVIFGGLYLGLLWAMPH